MRGTEFITGMISEIKKSARRAGREVSQESIDRLSAIHQKLQQGHDTVDEAMRELAAFLAEKAGDDGTDKPPTSADGYSDPMADLAGTGTGNGIDTADARSRASAVIRGASGARRQRPVYRPSGRPELFTVGNVRVRSSTWPQRLR